MRSYAIAKSTVAILALNAAAVSAHAQAGPPAPGAASTSAEPTAPAAKAASEQPEGDIVVTATRQETLLQNTPVALTALSAKSLEQRGVRTLLDIGNYVPNLATGGRGGQGTNQGSVSIRGMGTDAPDSSPSVGIYIDEVYYPSLTGNLLGLFDVARVEVLRGPQGTLFGRNTIAGAIQYVSVKPTVDQFSGFAFASGGSRNSYEASGAVNIPLGTTLAARISGQVAQQGGYVFDQLNGVDRGKDYREQGRVQLRWQPVDGLTIDLKGEMSKLTNNGRPVTVNGFDPSQAGLYLLATGIIPPAAGGLPTFLTERRPFLPGYVQRQGSRQNSGFNAPDFARVRYRAVNGVIAYDLTDDIRLKSISAYSVTRSHIAADIDATPLFILASDGPVERIELFTQELQLTGNSIGDRLHWTAGLYYYDSRSRLKGTLTTIGLAPLPAVPTTEIKTRSYAAYGQATFDIVGGLSATGGVRYSRENVRGDYISAPLPSSKNHFNDTSPYIGLNWQVTDDALLYAKASKGFRAGGYRLDPSFAGGSLYFGPETAWTYEAGARLQFLDHRLRFNPTVFLTNWDNIQFVYVSLIGGRPVIGTRNAGDARLKGAELESQFAVTPAFQLTGSFSFLDSNYRRLAAPAPGSIPIVLTLQDSLARAPRYKYSIGGRYTIAGGDGSKAVLSADYAWTDRQRSSVDRDQAVSLPRYGLLNARIEFSPAGGNFTFAVFGTNLTNKYYLLDGINFRSNDATEVQTIGRPREYGASARINF